MATTSRSPAGKRTISVSDSRKVLGLEAAAKNMDDSTRTARGTMNSQVVGGTPTIKVVLSAVDVLRVVCFGAAMTRDAEL